MTDVPCISNSFVLIFRVNMGVHGDEQPAVQNENGMVIDGVWLVGDGAQEFHDNDCSFWRALSCIGVERATVSK
jgi:hypothetical protein